MVSALRKFEISLDGRTFTVLAQKVGQNIWCHFNGQSYSFAAKDKSSTARDSESVESEPGVLRAPMPGKVIKVAAQKSEKVNKGQVLIVLEAMKMEYSIETDLDGVVANLNCSEGQQVALGDILLEVSEK